MLKAFIGSSNNIIFDDFIREIGISTYSGRIGILPGHNNLISSIKIGELKVIDKDNQEHIYSVSDGVLKVENINGETIANLLFEDIDHINDLNEKDIQEAINRAEKISKEKIDIDFDIEKQLFRDLNKLKIVRKYKRI